MMTLPFWLKTKTTALLHDVAMIPLAWIAAWWISADLQHIAAPDLHNALVLLPFLMILQIPVFLYSGLYRGVWRFASLPDLVRILRAVGTGLVIAVVGVFLFSDIHNHMPRSVFPLYAMMLVMALSLPRFFYRLSKDRGHYRRPGRQVLIAGAGRAGEMLVRDLLRDQRRDFVPVAFIDDDVSKLDLEIHGVRVVGNTYEIPRVVDMLEVELILLAMPSASAAQIRRIVEVCESTGVEFKTLPRIQDLISGRPTLDDLREVSIEDLLGRKPVDLNWGDIQKGIYDRTILVTGGGGSIGSELCRQIAPLNPRRLVIMELSEFALYTITQELAHRFPELELIGKLGDATDEIGVDRLLAETNPDVIFHAAAFKHVPILQEQAREAVRNNVFGTEVMARAADKHEVDSFVLISTDKAVNPVNVLGASKRAAELICEMYNGRSQTRFVTVRFGNVLGSAGSVIPLFKQQIQRGGPVTVTHRDVMRYFMTIPEAAQLILQSTVMGQGGEIFLLDMGEPVKIRYLAEQLIRLVGKIPGEDIEIIYTGLRPGEKISEELFHNDEHLAATPHENILLAKHHNMDWSVFSSVMIQLHRACEAYDENHIHSLMARVSPSYQSALKGDQDKDGKIIPFRAISTALKKQKKKT